MTVTEAIRKRYSCRAYRQKSLEPEKLTAVLEAARLAPSARNFQDWRFVVVTEGETKRRVAETTNKPEVFSEAGAIIDRMSRLSFSDRKSRLFKYSMDISIAGGQCI